MMSVWSAIVVTIFASAAMNLGLVLQKKGLSPSDAGPVRHSTARNRRSGHPGPIWYAGLALLIIGYAVYWQAVSSRSAPISLLQPVFASGLIVVAVMAVVYLHEHFGPLEWLGVGLLLSGVILLGMSAEGSPTSASSVDMSKYGAFLSGAATVALMVLLMLSRPVPVLRPEFLIAVLAGLLLGTGYLNTKVLAVALDAQNSRLSLLAGGCMALGLIGGLAVLQIGFRKGRALIVTAVNLVTNQLVVVAGGIVCLSERFPREPAAFIARIAGLAAILIGIVFLARVSAAANARWQARENLQPADAGRLSS